MPEDQRPSRASLAVAPSDRFRLQDQSYQLQYAHIYYQRLSAIRPGVLSEAARRWDSSGALHVPKVLDMPLNERCYATGIIYADLPLKPNVLDDLAQERYINPPPLRSKYTSDKDSFVLEDDSGRIVLVGDRVRSELLITGIVVGVLGVQRVGGELEVEDFCFAGLAPQRPLPSLPAPKRVMLVSGLNIGLGTTNPLLQQMLCEYISGDLGGDSADAASIARLIVAGRSINTGHDASKHAPLTGSTKEKAAAAAALLAESAAALRAFDELLVELCSNVPTDVMPGETDPARLHLPQQPMSRALFAHTKTLSTLTLCTNPHQFDADGVRFLGTSGQNVDDLFKYVHEEDRLALLEAMLRWRHIAPTAPDTLGCVPLATDDPFVLDESPHVFFVGGQDKFGSKLVSGPDGQRVLIVSVPIFSTTGTAVVVDIQSLTATPVTFKPWDSGAAPAPAADA